MDLFTQHYPDPARPEHSAYYYWYRFMQLIEGYGRKHPLWKDFGDVRMPFWDWWVACGESLFMTGLKDGVWELIDEGDFKRARDDGAFVLRIDADCSRKHLLMMFKDFLDEKRIASSPGRKPHRDEVQFARYPFYQRPDASSLRTILDVWNRRHPRSDTKPPTLYSIGVELRLQPESVILRTDEPDIVDVKRNVMNATVSRYERWGRNILVNVAQGLFPKLK